jgi:hypothetical protein
MKRFAAVAALLLFTWALASVPLFSQDRNDRPAQAQDDRKDNDKPAPRAEERSNRPEERTAPQQEKRDDSHPAAVHDEHARPDADRNHAQPAAARPKENRQEQRPEQRMDRDRDRQQHPVQAERGKRIPDDRFRSNFGRQHHFHVERSRVVNVSQPVVVYGGYSFQLVDAWPADWSYDDDCYIDYVDDGYYLFDVMHPGMRIAVFVVE